MVKMEYLHLNISEDDRRTIENKDCYRDFYKCCLQEFDKIKEAKFYNNVSLFNIAMKVGKMFSGYARNDELL